jgi:hypothetical protein
VTSALAEHGRWRMVPFSTRLPKEQQPSAGY